MLRKVEPTVRRFVSLEETLVGSDWTHAQNVLCVRLDALGDVLMTSPALRALKTVGKNVTLLTSPAGSAITPFLPFVDQTLVDEAPWMKVRDRGAASVQALVARLKELRFDGAIIFTVYSQNPMPAAMLSYLAEIPLRLAYCRENPYHLLTDWRPETEPQQTVRHEVRRQIELVEHVLGSSADDRLFITVPQEARRAVAERLTALSISPSRPLIVFHPGASAASRRYPPESFGEAAELLVQNGYQVIVTAGREEMPLVRTLVQAMRARPPVLSELSLGELAALFERASLVIANNSAPAHIAAAVHTPVVDLYALTNPQHAPWGVPHRLLFHDVPCKNCYKSVCPEGHHLCLTAVRPREIVHAALELLAHRLPILHEDSHAHAWR